LQRLADRYAAAGALTHILRISIERSSRSTTPSCPWPAASSITCGKRRGKGAGPQAAATVDRRAEQIPTSGRFVSSQPRQSKQL